jgi:hypothetical protein
MPRTDPSAVLTTFDADADSVAVEQWITQASLLVDDVADESPHLTSDRLRQIETLVAQHFLSAQHPRFDSQSGASRDASFSEGRSGSAYLDRAQRIDPTGVVADSLTQDDFIVSDGRH